MIWTLYNVNDIIFSTHQSSSIPYILSSTSQVNASRQGFKVCAYIAAVKSKDTCVVVVFTLLYGRKTDGGRRGGNEVKGDDAV